MVRSSLVCWARDRASICFSQRRTLRLRCSPSSRPRYKMTEIMVSSNVPGTFKYLHVGRPLRP